MTRRSRDVVVGLASFAGLFTLLVGPPVALAHFVGWPLPTRLPGIEVVTSAARGGIDDMVVVKSLAVMAWLIWVQLALAAAVEILSLVRGRAPGRVRALPGLQVGVARLVAAVALVAAGAGTQRPAPLPMAHLVAVVAQPTTIEAPSEHVERSSEPVAGAGAPAAASTPPETYVAKKNDSWWRIAQVVLGDGARWKEIRGLNLGRTMADGTVIGPSTEIMRRDWQILVPGSDETAAPATPTATAEPGEEVAVHPGDNLWKMAERHLQDQGSGVSDIDVRAYWERLIEANRDRLADPLDPDRIYTGQLIRMPAIPGAPAPAEVDHGQPAPGSVPEPAPAPPSARLPVAPDQPAPASVTSSEPSLPPSLPESAPSPAMPERSGEAHAPADDRAGAAVGLLGAASTMLAVGIASVLTRRRRRRQDQLPPGTLPPAPPPDLDALRGEIVAEGDVDHAGRLGRAMRDIAAALGERDSEARPRLVQVQSRRVEALLSQAVLPAPLGWRADAAGSAWVLTGEPQDAGAEDVAPNPALVTIGRPEARSELYLDLEAEGVIALTGEAGPVTDVARSWVLELATSPLASGASVVVVGNRLQPDSASSDRLRVVNSWAEIAGDALTWVEQSAALVKASGWVTPPAGRMVSQRVDDLAPLVIVTERPAGDDRFDTLCSAVLEGQVAVVVVVVGSTVEGATVVEVGGDEIRIPSLGLTCQPQAVSVAAAEQVDQLLEDASRLPAQLSLMPLPAPRSPVITGPSGDDYQDPPCEILVRFLGDIRVVGGSSELKPKQLAVLAYIALHAPVASERVGDAVWVATTTSRRKRLANTVSEIRCALGARHLPLASDGRYRVQDVATDLARFERRLAWAAGQDQKAAAATLRGALDLVDGPVFTYRNADRASYVWVDVENWISTWELKVTDTAEDLAQRYLDLGDFEGAVWAAQRGLLASRTHTRLTKVLIKAHFANGDARAAEQVFESHQAALEKLDLDDVDAELVDFYYDARRARGAAAAS